MKYLDLLSKVSLKAIDNDSFDNQMNLIIRIIGENLNVSRVYIFNDSNDGQYCNNEYEWCNKGIESQIHNLQNFPYSIMPSWKLLLNNKGFINSSNIDNLPKDIQEILKPQGILAIIVYPLFNNQKISGFIGFDECIINRKWKSSELKILKTISGIISNSYEKQYNQNLYKQKCDLLSNKLQNIIDASHLGTWEWNIKNRNVLINDRYAEILGYTSEELSPMTYESWIKYQHPDDLQNSIDMLYQHFRREIDFFEIEFRMKHKNGDWKWILGRGQVIEWDNLGNPLIMLGTHSDISDRKLMEENLININNRFNELAKQSKTIIWETDPSGLYTYISDYCEDFFGYSSQEIIGAKYFYDLHPEKGKEEFKKQAFKVFSRKESFVNINNPIQKKDGCIIWVSTNGIPILKNDGSLIGYRGLDTDITEILNNEKIRLSLEKELKNTNKLLEAVINQIPVPLGLAILPRLIFKYINKAAEEHLMINANDYLNKNPMQVKMTWKDMTPDGRLLKTEELPMQLAMKGVVTNNLEIMVERHDGSRVWELASASPIYDENNNIIAGILILVDISKIKNMSQELASSELKYRNLFENMTTGFALQEIFYDESGKPLDYRFLEVNPAFEKLTGLLSKQIIGKSALDIFSNVETSWIDIIQKVVSTGMSIEYENFSAEIGKYFYIYAFCPEKNRLAVIINDITERKLAEAKVIDMNINLENRIKEALTEIREKDYYILQQSRLTSLAELLRNIAHHWRQPLASLSLIIQNITNSKHNDTLTTIYLEEKTTKALSIIYNMSKTIDDFKNMYNLNEEISTFSIGSVIRECISLIILNDDKHIDVELTEEMDINIQGMRSLLFQAIINILLNSKEIFLSRFTTEPKIKIEIKMKGEKPNIIISDNAGGVENSLISRLFEPYFTTKDNGTGMGLYITKNIIDKNFAGNIFCKNINNGVCFNITLPFAQSTFFINHTDINLDEL